MKKSIKVLLITILTAYGNSYSYSQCTEVKDVDMSKYKKLTETQDAQGCSQCAMLALYFCSAKYSVEVEDIRKVSSLITVCKKNIANMGQPYCCPELVDKEPQWGVMVDEKNNLNNSNFLAGSANTDNQILAAKSKNSLSLNSPNNNTQFENIVNDKFGSLLESLIINGKIDEGNAKAYLEIVLGFDDSTDKYLQTTNLVDQISGINQGSMPMNDFIPILNNNLISFIPQEKQQAFANHMEAQMMVKGAVNEIISGKIAANTISLAAGLIEGMQDYKELKLKNEAIVKKLEIITPTLNKLNASNETYVKLKVVDDCDSYENWVGNIQPAVIEDEINKRTTNHSLIENGVLKINTQNYVQAVFNWDKPTYFEKFNFYKNKEKFDFSKDFSMNLYFKMERKVDQSLQIEIGQGFQLSINRQEGFLFFLSPVNYMVTSKYGKLVNNTKIKIKREIVFSDKTKGITHSVSSGNYMTIQEKKNPNINFDGILKITITKKGNTFSFKFNDLPHEVKSDINYFPNKYSLEFLVTASNKKAYVDFDKLELEHL